MTITASGNFQVTQVGSVNVVLASGQFSTTVGLAISGQVTYSTSLQWGLKVPLGNDGKPDMNANLIVDYTYNYNGTKRSGQIRIPVTLNQIVSNAAARAAAAAFGAGGGGDTSAGNGTSIGPGVSFPPPAASTPNTPAETVKKKKKASVNIGNPEVVEFPAITKKKDRE